MSCVFDSPLFVPQISLPDVYESNPKPSLAAIVHAREKFLRRDRAIERLAWLLRQLSRAVTTNFSSIVAAVVGCKNDRRWQADACALQEQRGQRSPKYRKTDVPAGNGRFAYATMWQQLSCAMRCRFTLSSMKRRCLKHRHH